MLIPNFSVVKLARKAAYRSDGDMLAKGSSKPGKPGARVSKATDGEGTAAKAKPVRALKKR